MLGHTALGESAIADSGASRAGDLVRPVDVGVQTIYSFYGDRLTQPIRVRAARHGALAQAVGVTTAHPVGSVAQAVAVRLSGSGDCVHAVSVTTLDTAARSTGWLVRVSIGGTDVSNRCAGIVSVTGQEGGARVAEFNLVPAGGPVNPQSLVGAAVEIDLLTEADGYWAPRRCFTGLVHLPEYDVANRTFHITCTDDLQNRLAALPRADLDTITGGRYSEAVHGEPRDNYDYAQMLMSTIPASLDADAWGALRVTAWDGLPLWKAYDVTSTEDGSIEFTAPQRTGLVNSITAIVEYRYARLHRRTASFRYVGNMADTIKYALPLLARATVESALQSTGWNIYTKPNGAPDISYTPYPEVVEIPLDYSTLNGFWFQRETETTCLGASCSAWRKWAQIITEVHTLTITAPESIAQNGILSQEISAALESKWNADEWERNATMGPKLDGGGFAQVIDYAPDVTTTDRNDTISTIVDVAKVKILASHRRWRAKAVTWVTPDLDTHLRVSITHPSGSTAEGKVVRVEHVMDMDTGRATTAFEIAISGHGAIGLPEVTPTPSAPPEVPEPTPPGNDVRGALFSVGTMHVGGLETSPPEDDEWQGWMVNTLRGINVTTDNDANSTTATSTAQFGTSEPDGRRSTAFSPNPLHVGSKVYNEGFRVIFPEVEAAARDAQEIAVSANYQIPIPVDPFDLYA